MNSIFDTATVVDQNNQPVVQDTPAPPTADSGTPAADAAAAPPPANPDTPVVLTEATPDKIFGESWAGKKWEDVKSDYDTRVQKVSEYEKLIEDQKNKRPEYANEDVEAFDAWVRNGGSSDVNVFSRVRTVDVTKLDGIDAIITQKVIEHPQFRGMEGQLKQELIDQYNLVSTDEKPLTDEQIAFNKAKLEVEASKSKEYLSGLKGKMQIQRADPAEQQKAFEEAKVKHIQGWTPVIDKVFADFKSIPISIPKVGDSGKIEKDDKGNVVFENLGEYPVPEHLQKQYKDLFAADVAKFPVLDANSESRLRQSAINRFKVENDAYIMAHALDKQRTSLIEEYDKKYGGAGTLPPPGPKGGPNNNNLSTAEQHNTFRTTVFNNSN